MPQHVPRSVTVHLPYNAFDRVAIVNALFKQISASKSGDDSHVESITKMLVGFLSVYVVQTAKRNRNFNNSEYNVYVEETNNRRARTMQYLKSDVIVREDWSEFAKRLSRDPDSVRQYIIGNPHSNKSLTLDAENQLMHYLLGVPTVRNLNNRRPNAQGDYYTSDEFDEILKDIWLQLHDQDPELFRANRLFEIQHCVKLHLSMS
jgi:hypothetical protein